MFSTISSFQVTETLTPLLVNSNVSLFPNDILAYDSSSSLSQSTTSPKKFPLVVEPVDSSTVIHSSLLVSPPPPLHCTFRVSQPSVLLRDYV